MGDLSSLYSIPPWGLFFLSSSRPSRCSHLQGVSLRLCQSCIPICHGRFLCYQRSRYHLRKTAKSDITPALTIHRFKITFRSCSIEISVIWWQCSAQKCCVSFCFMWLTINLHIWMKCTECGIMKYTIIKLICELYCFYLPSWDLSAIHDWCGNKFNCAFHERNSVLPRVLLFYIIWILDTYIINWNNIIHGHWFKA